MGYSACKCMYFLSGNVLVPDVIALNLRGILQD